MNRRPREMSVLVSELQGLRVALPAGCVQEIASPQQVQDDEEAVVDLAQRWQLRQESEVRLPRRVLRLQGGALLKVGEVVELRTVPRDGLQAVPELLTELCDHVGIAKVLLLESGIGYLLDPDRLSRWQEEVDSGRRL